ncbi:MAG: hypothetical protein ACRD0V_01820 [Acidimicrobiales bacterium]
MPRRRTPAERLARREARFIRARNSRAPWCYRRPGEFSLPGIKLPGLLAAVAAIAVWVTGIANPIVVLVVGFVLVNAVVFVVLQLVLGGHPQDPPREPPFGNAGDRSPLVPGRR